MFILKSKNVLCNILLVTILMLFSALTYAESTRINYNGYLTNSEGMPLNKTIKMKFSVYNNANECDWNRERYVTVNEGQFNVVLGKKNILPDELFDGEHYIGVAVKFDDEYEQIELRRKINKLTTSSKRDVSVFENIVLDNRSSNSDTSKAVKENKETLNIAKTTKEKFVYKFDDTISAISKKCDSSIEGSLRYNAERKAMEFCNGSAWLRLLTDKDVPVTYYKSCKDILDAGKSTGDGIYTIRPLGVEKPFQVFCDMTTDGGGWTKCGWIDELYAENSKLVVKESNSYITHSNLRNASFCEKWYTEQKPKAMLIHNLTEGSEYGYNQKIKVAWGSSPFKMYHYNVNHKIQLCENLTKGKVYSNCQYSAHTGWTDTSFSFTINNLNTGYWGNASKRLILGPTTSSTGNKPWHNFGADSNSKNIANDWTSGMNIGYLYMR